jgi:hypothetical protein
MYFCICFPYSTTGLLLSALFDFDQLKATANGIKHSELSESIANALRVVPSSKS